MTGAQNPQERFSGVDGHMGGKCSKPTSYAFLNRPAGQPAGQHHSSQSDQPSALALALYDELPEGFLAYSLPDHSCDPLIRVGEIAVIDIEDREPVYGALYLRRIISSNGCVSVRIVENLHHLGRFAGENGERCDEDCSVFISHNRPKGVEQWRAWSQRFGIIPLADGPCQLNRSSSRPALDSLLGRVVGILASKGAFR
jgi:hypothetical protein